MNNFKKNYVSPEANVIIVDEDIIMTSQVESGETGNEEENVEFPPVPVN